MVRTRHKVSLCGSFALMLLASLCAVAAGDSGPRESFQAYGEESGLGNSTILSLFQSKSGYLWVGTESGLYRYEGSLFRLMDSSAGLSCLAEIKGITEATDGALWVIACNHLYRYSDGRFEIAPHKDIIVDSLQALSSDGAGGVLVGTQEGLLQASQKREVRMFPLPASVGGKEVRGLLLEGPRLWFSAEQQLLCLEEGQLTRYGADDGLPTADWDGIRMGVGGDLWVRSVKQTYRRARGQPRFHAVTGPAPSFNSGYLAISSDGSALIPTNDGLAVANDQGVRTLGEKQGLRTSFTSVALEDREGSIWIGLMGEGLVRWLGRGEWQNWTKDNGLPSNMVWSIMRARLDRALWVGTAQGVVRFAANGQSRVWGWEQQLNGTVRGLREAWDGGIWVIAQGGTLARIDPHSGAIVFFGPKAFFGANEPVTAKYVVRGNFDATGNLWLATRSGVFMAAHPTANSRFEKVAGTPVGIWDVAEDKQGAIFATSAKGLWRYFGGHWRRYDKNDGLLSDSPYVIAVGPDGALWLRHRYDGVNERVQFDGERIVRVTAIKPKGVPTELTALHGFDARGEYWQGTSDGLALLANPADLLVASESTAKVDWRYFTVEDGLVSNDCDGEAFWADDDGSVWIGTSKGLSRYSPLARAGKSAQPANTANGPTITDMQVSQRPRSARIEFSSLNFRTEGQTQFAYSLDGGNWIDAKARSVTLASLRPGMHLFRVRMRIWGHQWSAQTTDTKFVFEPFWWETWWATTLLYLGLGAGIVGGVRLWMNMHKRRVAERVQILEEKAHAEAASQAKSQFLTHMSHEIRTPLHQIIGLTEDLAAMNLPDDASQITDDLRSSGQGLFNLLNGILDFSKIEAGELRVENAPFNLDACLEESARLFSRAAAEKGLTLKFESEPSLHGDVIGDATRLRQVLVCLISNAIKFTDKGHVKVCAVNAGQNADNASAELSVIEFSVVDSGIGMSAEMVARLFRPFTQGDASTSRKYGGAGLGLIIAGSLVQLMGGKEICVRSEIGSGSSFRFSIPFQAATAAKPLQTSEPVVSDTRILVVEDNKINQKIMLNLLARMGYKADLAGDGAEAIDAVKMRQYDVVLMDIQMPKVNGWEATRAIRAYFAGRTQPKIFAVTAHATNEDRNECLRAGMDGYLTKPVNAELLAHTLAGVGLEEVSDGERVLNGG